MQIEQFQDQINSTGLRYGETGLYDSILMMLDKREAICICSNVMCFILKPITDSSARQGMFIWLGIHNRPNQSKADFSAIEALAKNTGMQFIQFQTKRKGFIKLATRFGFEPVGTKNGYTQYHKEVI